MPTPRSLDTPAPCPRLTAPRLPRLGHRSTAPTAHHPELIPPCPTGGYLRAPPRSLCFRPLALPSAPVAPLRPASAAPHQRRASAGHRENLLQRPRPARPGPRCPRAQRLSPHRTRRSVTGHRRKQSVTWPVRIFFTAIKDETTRRIVRPNCTCISPNRSRAQACRNVGNSARTRLGIPVNRGMTGMAEPSVAPSLYR